jgi:hypothetical protein
MSRTTSKGAMPGQQAESGATSPGRAPQTNPAAPRERIQARAYEIFQARKNNGRQGDAASDWMQAERELNGAAPGVTAGAEVEAKAQARGEH